MVSLLDFINSISYTDDIQDVIIQTDGEKLDLLSARGRGIVRPPWIRACITKFSTIIRKDCLH